MSAYTKKPRGGVIRNADNVHIPEDERNRDYREFLAWVAAGGVADEYVEPPAPVIVPASVKMWQAKAALAAAGKLEAANAAVAGSGNTTLKLAWEYAADISRASDSVAAIGASLGLDSAALDALFIAAAQIQV